MTEKPTSISAGELAREWETKWKPLVEAGTVEISDSIAPIKLIYKRPTNKYVYHWVDDVDVPEYLNWTYAQDDDMLQLRWHDAPPADPVAAKRRLPLTVDDYKRDVAEIVKNHNLDHSQPYDAIEKLLQYIDVLEYQQMRYERSIEHHATENERLAEALRQAEAEVTRLRGELETWHNYSGDCPYCEGNGVVVVGWDNDVYENIEADCPYCKGTGNWRGDDEAAEASDQ